MRDLLPRCASLRWDSYIAAIIRMPARVRARVSSSVRSGLRCLDEFHATGISAHLVRSTACAATDGIWAESASRATITFNYVKQGRQSLKSEVQKRFDRISRLS
jgi:hypothetical protein